MGYCAITQCACTVVGACQFRVRLCYIQQGSNKAPLAYSQATALQSTLQLDVTSG